MMAAHDHAVGRAGGEQPVGRILAVPVLDLGDAAFVILAPQIDLKPGLVLEGVRYRDEMAYVAHCVLPRYNDESVSETRSDRRCPGASALLLDCAAGFEIGRA